MAERLKRFLAGWFRNDLGRTRFANWEWAIMRLLFAPAIWRGTWRTWDPRTIDIRDFEELEEANGLAALLDLSWLATPTPTLVASILFALFLLLYLSGRLAVVATGGLFLIHWAAASIANSPQGNHHDTQIVGTILLGQFAFFLWRALRKKDGPVAPGAIRWSQQMIAAGYVVAGISKLVNSGGRWIGQIPNMAVDFSKNLDQAYYDHLRPAEGIKATMNQWAVDFVGESPNLARLLFGSGLFLEFGALLALINRRLSLAMGLALIGMHESISKIMQLNFYFNKWLLFVFFVNLPFWLYFIWTKVRGIERKLG